MLNKIVYVIEVELNMPRSNSKPQLVKYQQHGILRNTPNREEETWIFETEDLSSELIDYELTDVLNDLSMDGWELVCRSEDGYILRTKAELETTIEIYETEDETIS
jgi:hypothetical protein